MQNWGKSCVFGHIDKFWKGHDGQIKKNACKHAYLGSIFTPEKYLFRVCFESLFTRMISSLKYKCPPRWQCTIAHIAFLTQTIQMSFQIFLGKTNSHDLSNKLEGKKYTYDTRPTRTQNSAMPDAREAGPGGYSDLVWTGVCRWRYIFPYHIQEPHSSLMVRDIVHH